MRFLSFLIKLIRTLKGKRKRTSGINMNYISKVIAMNIGEVLELTQIVKLANIAKERLVFGFIKAKGLI